MRNKLLLSILSMMMVFLSAATVRADYSNTVMSLAPVAYWPLNETVQPPPAYVATNSGTLGALGDGYYEIWFNLDSGDNNYTTMMDWTGPVPGATSDGDGAANFASDANRYIEIPRTDTNAILNPPFTLECWVYVTNTTSWGNMIGAGGQVNSPDDAAGDWAGCNLNIYNGNWLFDVYNNNQGNHSLELSSGVTVGQWTHVVAEFDGTNAILYVNGSEAAAGVPTTNSLGQYYVPDKVNPITIGSLNRPKYINAFPGYIDEVAIYTNLLSPTDIANHYNDATAGGYAAAVLADSPIIYLRLDEPLYTLPSQSDYSAFPTAYNYGSAGSGANGVYQPGTRPGLPGPTGTGFGTANYSVAINGMNSAVDVGGGNLATVAPSLNVTGTNALSVVAWFKGNPADSYNRFQTILGHGDSGWRFGQGNNGPQFNPGSSGDLGYDGGDIYNDGRWHMVAGVFTGTTNYLYFDGGLAVSTPNSTSNAGNGMDVLLGGAPDYTGPYGRYWAGSLAQVAFFTNSLTATNISLLYSVAGIAPYFLVQPASNTVDGGTAYTNSTLVDGSAPIHYQWYLNDSIVAGQTNESLVYSSVQGADAGSYYLVATNLSGSVTSSIVSLNVNTSPQIETESATNFTLFIGGGATFSVGAIGAQPLNYYWKLGGEVVGTNSIYDLTNAVASGSYVCVISNYLGSITSSVVMLTVVPQPTNTYPQSVIAANPIAYWRLNEAGTGYPNNGVVGIDYWGGNNGIYTNTVLGATGYPSTPSDPDTAALFGDPAAADSDLQVPGMSFAQPNGSNAEFTLEAWVQVVNTGYLNGDGDGIIAKGYGGGGEQYDLDAGAGTSAFRFLVRDVSGGVHIAETSAAPDTSWHHVVGVCDEAKGEIYLYVDGVLAGTGAIAPNSGLQSSSAPLGIGSRQSGEGTTFDDQFPGTVDEVAIYNYPLTSAQVSSQYYASGGFAPVITTEPVSATVNAGEDATFTAVAGGSPVLSLQWYNVTTGSPGTPVAGATNATLTLENVSATENGNLYQLLITNTYGQLDSSTVMLTVKSGPPVLVSDIEPTSAKAFAGMPLTLTVSVSGTPPFAYFWKQDGSVTGPDTSQLTIAVLPGTNTYSCLITNAEGSISSGTATVVGVSLTDSGTNTADSSTTFAVNFMDAANASYTTDNGSTWTNVVYQGLGAYPDDTDNTNWNGFGIFPNGYLPTYNSTTIPQVASDGTLTPITLSLVYGFDSGALAYGPGYSGPNTAQGQPSLLLGECAVVNGSYSGVGTSSDPLGGITLSNVPAGTYTLYLYGANVNNDRGATFSFNTGAALGGTNTIINSDPGAGPASNFVYGVSFVIFTNVTPSAAGVISGTWGAVSNPKSGNTGEGDFNGLQLVRVSGEVGVRPTMTIQLIDGKAVISWTPSAGTLQSATSLEGPYTTVSGASSPYTNSVTVAQEFFRVSVQ